MRDIIPGQLTLKHYLQGGEQGEAPVAVPRPAQGEDVFDVENPFEQVIAQHVADVAAGATGTILTTSTAHVVSASVNTNVAKTTHKESARAIQDDTTDDTGEDEIDEDTLVAWLAQQTWSTFAQSLALQVRKGRPLTARQLESARSMHNKCEQRAAERAQREQEEIALRAQEREQVAHVLARKGPLEANRIYKVSTGTMYRVQWNKAKTYLYAKVLVGARFEYQDGAIRRLECDETREQIGMSDAVEFGARTGVCVCCGRTLTKGASVQAGIGPVCASKWNL